jgi:hypothetical protein
VYALACSVVLLFGGRPDPGLVAVAVLGTLATWTALRSALSGNEGGEAAWQVPRAEPVRPPGRDPRLDLLERQVDAHLVSRAGDAQLPRQLVRLADQRLMDRHGVRRDTNPRQAAALLGPELAALAERAASDRPDPANRPHAGVPSRASGGPGPRLTPTAVDALLSRIEAL